MPLEAIAVIAFFTVLTAIVLGMCAVMSAGYRKKVKVANEKAKKEAEKAHKLE